MRKARHLVLFLKAPRRGAVKRRLAADIGRAAAFHFYRQTTAALIRRLGVDRRWQGRLAITPDRFAAGGVFWPVVPRRMALARTPQGLGDLGVRMRYALSELPVGPRVLVGGDIPDITAAHIASAFDALRRHDFVFGPAVDGGFWLVGMRRPPPRALFKGVRFSTSHALADTLATLRPGCSVAFIDELEDVDDGAAWVRWRRRASLLDVPAGGA